jgi:RluA family pseudouridine synthase
MKPDELQARILYKDANLIILDKPAGLAVHAGPTTKHDLEQYLPALQFERKEPPHLAHRLDRDTSGCLALGRHAKALSKLGRLFQAGAISKAYWALVQGNPKGDNGTITAPLLKVTRRGEGWRIIVDKHGQPAVTDWKVLARTDGLAWLELSPRTGRTHQIRVHCAHIGLPLVGDITYGQAGGTPQPMMLHARRLTIPYREGAAPIIAEAPPPPAMAAYLRAMGWSLPQA